MSLLHRIPVVAALVAALAAPAAAAPPTDTPPVGRDAAEKRIISVLQELKRGPNYANVSVRDGRLLRQITEMSGAKKVVELGTSSGYSGLWLALALRKTGGRLFTHEISRDMAKLATANFKRAGVDAYISIVMGDAHTTVLQHVGPDKPLIDIVFLDADKKGYIDYLRKLLPQVRPGGMIIAHNMVYPKPDPRYVKAITTNPNLDTMFVLMDGAGMALTLKKR